VSGQYCEGRSYQPFLGRLLEARRRDQPEPPSFGDFLARWKSICARDPTCRKRWSRIDTSVTIVRVCRKIRRQPRKELPLLTVRSMAMSIAGRRRLLDSRSHKVFSVVRIRDVGPPCSVPAELNTIAAPLPGQYRRRRGFGGQGKLARPGLIRDWMGRAVARISGCGMGWPHCASTPPASNPRQPVAAFNPRRPALARLAIRMAIAAGRWRILARSLVEAIVISTSGVRAHVASSWMAITGLAGLASGNQITL